LRALGRESNTRSETGLGPGIPFQRKSTGSKMAITQSVNESLLEKMSTSIWEDDLLCQEEKYLKKKWFVRNGQDTMKDEGFPIPVLTVVVQSVKKKNVCFGPVIQVAMTGFVTGKGKSKETHEALNFLTLSKEHGFLAVILDPREFDMEMTLNFTKDEVALELIAVTEANAFTSNWYQRFVNSSEQLLLPIVQGEYERRAGAPWKKTMKLKIQSVRTDKSTSTTPRSTSTAMGSVNKGPADPLPTETTPHGLVAAPVVGLAVASTGAAIPEAASVAAIPVPSSPARVVGSIPAEVQTSAVAALPHPSAIAALVVGAGGPVAPAIVPEVEAETHEAPSETPEPPAQTAIVPHVPTTNAIVPVHLAGTSEAGGSAAAQTQSEVYSPLFNYLNAYHQFLNARSDTSLAPHIPS